MANFRFSFTVSPKFNVKEIINDTIGKDWIRFQHLMFLMGEKTHSHMIAFITRNHKRRGGTGKLANAITFDVISTGPAKIEWGIGEVSKLQREAPYWYVVNYGKMTSGIPFIPNRGNFVPGSFEGKGPDNALTGGTQKFNYNDGSRMGMYPKTPIRPMNYIQVSVKKFNKRLRKLIKGLKRRV